MHRGTASGRWYFKWWSNSFWNNWRGKEVCGYLWVYIIIEVFCTLYHREIYFVERLRKRVKNNERGIFSREWKINISQNFGYNFVGILIIWTFSLVLLLKFRFFWILTRYASIPISLIIILQNGWTVMSAGEDNYL